MSLCSEMKKCRDLLVSYPLMSTREVAAFLRIDKATVNRLFIDKAIPWVMVGSQYRVDPLDLAVYFLAGRDGISADEYWELHGEATPEYARRYFRRIMKLLA